ncbi:MAG TPA: zinc ribbon domain-containing protein [Anaerolineaceae bacterium]|nr:zinc ribbon domain-containing protein [Anaerolineaceae bacterium]
MDQRIYHGTISPDDVARSLIAHFNRGNLRVIQVGQGDRAVVQIASHEHPASGGQTALSVTVQKVEDGILVQVGQQAWLGVAASLGMTALSAFRNPLSLLGRLDDIAQDIESIQICEEVWKVVESTAQAAGAGRQLSERLRRLTCAYCSTANPVGESSCIACGAPLGDDQPSTCPRCGFVVTRTERVCPNCGQNL